MARAALPPIFEEYSRYHRHPKNKLCHLIGIPLIVFSAVGLLGKVGLHWGGRELSLAALLAAAAVLYCLSLSPRLTLPFAAFLLGAYWLAPDFAPALLWSGFVLGWVFQFVGHYRYEKKSPAFFTNLKQLLVGPLWIADSLIEMRRGRAEAPRSAPLER